MIILLLGITTVFTLKTMNEINQNFNNHIDFGQKITALKTIKEKYDKQNLIFNQLLYEKNPDIIGDFWIHSTEIKNELLNLKKFVTSDLKTMTIIDEKTYYELQMNVDSYYSMHLDYENSAYKAINYYYDSRMDGFSNEFEQMKDIQTQLYEKYDRIEKTLQLLPDSSKFFLSHMIEDFQFFQFIMIVLIGIVTLILVFYLNKVNANLKAEIKSHTINLKKLNKKLRQLDSKRKEFISIASHELKGPIQPIFGFLELVNNGIISKQEAFDGISNIVVHLENIANNVLDLTKIENNELDLHPEYCSINNVIQEVVNSEHFNPERRVPIKTDFDEDSLMSVDKTKIKQVFRNILDNCIKFTESGEIKIQTHLLKEERVLKIFFRDTGPEIPETVLPKIFEKFVTNNQNTITGFGLGLYISKKIIDSHGGSIKAYNQNKNPVFEISLPILKLDFSQKLSDVLTHKK